MQNAEVLIKDIKNKKLLPFYFLTGDYDFYINQISDCLIDNVLEDHEKDFNQSILYGKETTWEEAIGHAKQFPMMAERRLVVVKEAQHLSLVFDPLVAYLENPQPSTVFVVLFNGKTLDKRTKLYKSLKKINGIYESPRVYDNQLGDWIQNHAASLDLKLETKAKFMLAEHIGMNFSRIHNELKKLEIWAGDSRTITASQVEKYVGISKDYNSFELQNALVMRDYAKAQKICLVMSKNAKEHPLIRTLTVLGNFFTNLIVYHALNDKSKHSAAAAMGVSPFFVKDYAQAARSFSLKQTTRIISHIRNADLQSKGIGHTQLDDSGILKELVFKVFYAQ